MNFNISFLSKTSGDINLSLKSQEKILDKMYEIIPQQQNPN